MFLNIRPRLKKCPSLILFSSHTKRTNEQLIIPHPPLVGHSFEFFQKEYGYEHIYHLKNTISDDLFSPSLLSSATAERLIKSMSSPQLFIALCSPILSPRQIGMDISKDRWSRSLFIIPLAYTRCILQHTP